LPKPSLRLVNGHDGHNARAIPRGNRRVSGLNLRAIKSSLLGTIVMAALLFVPAQTLNYWQAWLFVAVFVSASGAITVYLAVHDPALLERRMKVGPGAETEPTQRLIMFFAMTGFIVLLVVPALDHRFGWTPVPASVSFLGEGLVALGFLVVFAVLRENTYGASTIQVVQAQKVISTGPYALVRHPMYAGALVLVAGMPLALGSWSGLVILVPFAAVLVWRLIDEERFLEKNLSGYSEYCGRVRYRLVPSVW
jgi:protein-S-isoprenylcysteine O-methyltransferase Ste14